MKKIETKSKRANAWAMPPTTQLRFANNDFTCRKTEVAVVLLNGRSLPGTVWCAGNALKTGRRKGSKNIREQANVIGGSIKNWRKSEYSSSLHLFRKWKASTWIGTKPGSNKGCFDLAFEETKTTTQHSFGSKMYNTKEFLLQDRAQYLCCKITKFQSCKSSLSNWTL